MKIVIDTNCLLMCIPKISPYRIVWDKILSKECQLCISNDILEEYDEILSLKTNSSIAFNVISTILESDPYITAPHFRFNLIQTDLDDNKFVDCAIASNASYIVTNDLHFKVLDSIGFPKVKRMNLSQFSNLLKGN